jgi:protein-tyrosine phosphatase
MATRKRRAENVNAGENAEIDLTRTPVPVNADEHLLQIPESRRCLISLTGKGLERTLLWKLAWMNYMYAPLHVL